MNDQRRTIGGYVAALFALVILVLGWREVLAPVGHMRYPVELASTAHGTIVEYVDRRNPSAAGITVGDPIDLDALGFAAHSRLRVGAPLGTKIDLRIRHDGVWVSRTVEPRYFPSTVGLQQVTFLFTLSLTLVLLAFIVSRRPSLATMALVLAGGGVVTTAAIVAQFSSLPDAVFAPIATFIAAAFSEFPIFALIVFMTRFPRVPTRGPARLRMHIGDIVFVSAFAFAVWMVLREPVWFVSWPITHNVYEMIGIVLTLVFAAFAYREAAGEDRQRIGWVLAGIIVTQASLFVYNLIDNLPNSDFVAALRTLSFAAQCALPLALAYAILRYRVIDLGFVLNRTMVYAIVTAVVVIAVSFVDWLSGKLISETRLALAAEALVTIGLGVALNVVHGRIEHLVDRVIFRQRYIAERRLRNRLDALAFVSSEAAIDSALTDEIVDILQLRSAAVFRSTGDPSFLRLRSIAWQSDAVAFDGDSLLVRAIRATGKPFFLADLSITDPALPIGESEPVLAVPIVRQNDFIGFVLYGRDRNGTAPDPEVVAHLGELAAAAATTYELVEARSWRTRYHALRHELGNGVTTR